MKVTLEEILAERERRAWRQKELLRQYAGGHDTALVCLTLNIAGDEKVFPLSFRCFQEEQRIVRMTLHAEAIGIIHEEATENNAGYAALWCVSAPPERVKEIAVDIEDSHPLGRLFDIDVIAPDGKKLSRSTANSGETDRKCLVCGGDAFACARSRAHDVRDVKTATVAIIENFLRIQLGGIIEQAAARALMSEVAVTPKPGLVDRANNGAHSDMHFFTFIDSVAAIVPYFRECALLGFESAAFPPLSLFESLRLGGKIAEIEMRQATGGVNTHKGAIFSFGILSAAYGRLFRTNVAPSISDVAELVRNMTARLLEDFADSKIEKTHSDTETSHGKTLYERYGSTGVRGEAAAGFPVVCEVTYPLVHRMLSEGCSVNDAGVAALLTLLARTDDTNIIHRAGIDELRRIQAEVAGFLVQEPPLPLIYEKARELDARFITQYISPGGCADLLALTFFVMFLLERGIGND